eukprot:c14572_g3_i1 orf=1-1437(+)
MQSEGVSPNVVTFVSALKACKIEFLDEGRKLHAAIVKKGLERNSLVGSSLVGMYAECGKLAEAQEMFEKLLVQDVILWTALISGYADHGKCKEALDCLEQMQKDGFSPDPLTYVCGLQACCGLRALDMGQILYSEAVKKGLEQDLYIGNALVEVYCKCAMLTESRKIFERLPVRDLVSWTSIIGGYAEYGHVEEALDCFHNMQLDGITPDVVAWNAVILGCLEHNECDKSLELIAQMQEQGLSPDSAIFINIINVCRSSLAMEAGKRVHAQVVNLSVPDNSKLAFETALVDMYGKCGSSRNAWCVFERIDTHNVLSWTALIAANCHVGHVRKALYLFEQMQKDDIQPDAVTFLSILSGCSHVGLVDEGLCCFHSMIEQHKFAPTLEHYACTVDLIGRAGRLEETVKFILQMPVIPGLVVWKTLLSVCKLHDDGECGKWAAQKISVLNPNTIALYVVLSNLCATDMVEAASLKLSNFVL